MLRRIVSSFLLNLLNIFFLFFSRFCVVRQQPERPASDPGDERISDRDQAVKSSAEALQRRFQALLRPQPALQPEWSPLHRPPLPRTSVSAVCFCKKQKKFVSCLRWRCWIFLPGVSHRWRFYRAIFFLLVIAKKKVQIKTSTKTSRKVDSNKKKVTINTSMGAI